MHTITVIKSTGADFRAGDPLDTLLMLLVKLTGDNGIEEQNLIELVNEAVAKYGSIEGAIQAIEDRLKAG